MPMWIFVVVFAYVGSQLLFMSIAAIDEWLATRPIRPPRPVNHVSVPEWHLATAVCAIFVLFMLTGVVERLTVH
jgi:hypothetical protein